jgi:hypothetical protein
MPLALSYSEARTQVEQLVDRFARNRDFYTRPAYKETQICVEFIDPLSEALGCFTQFSEQLPIRTIHFDDPADVARHDHMVAFVECMMDLQKKARLPPSPPIRPSIGARSRLPTGRSMRRCGRCTG